VSLLAIAVDALIYGGAVGAGYGLARLRCARDLARARSEARLAIAQANARFLALKDSLTDRAYPNPYRAAPERADAPFPAEEEGTPSLVPGGPDRLSRRPPPVVVPMQVPLEEANGRPPHWSDIPLLVDRPRPAPLPPPAPIALVKK
jgi:hypothetical protein